MTSKDMTMPTREQAIGVVDEYYQFMGAGGALDEDGSEALEAGSYCYNTAMNCQDAALHEARITYFQAAEHLYRVAQEKHHLFGYVNLGYVYYYDRCEGKYYPDFRDDTTSKEALDYCASFDRDKRAYECFTYCAEHGEPESCYKVGDMLKHGRGCEVNLEAAKRMYERAYELGKSVDPVLWGAAALRLGNCYEEGLGCDPDFSRALFWYEKAETGLEIAVKAGNWYYEKSLKGARDGVLRCKQELHGGY